MLSSPKISCFSGLGFCALFGGTSYPGIFHTNASELFIWLCIANGITQLGLDTAPLAVRYLLVGIVANFISGWSTEFTTKFVEKQQGVALSREFQMAK